MSHVVPVSDNIYHQIETLAWQRGVTPEALAETLLHERLAEHEAIAQQNAEWAFGLDEALDHAQRGENPIYDDMEAFFAALDEPVAGDEGKLGRTSTCKRSLPLSR